MQIHPLTDADIPAMLDLSLKIFEPPRGKKDPLLREKLWRNNFHKDGYALGAYIDGRLGGLLFCYNLGDDSHSLHCWMAGVLEEYRQQGVLKTLMLELEAQLRARGYVQLTVNTFPERYPIMYAFLNNHNFVEYKKEETEQYGKVELKSFFKKSLS